MDMLDDIEFHVAKLSLAPGETLVVRPARPITSVTGAELRAQLEQRLGLRGRVLVLDAGTELTVIAKGETVSAGAPAVGEGASASAKPDKSRR
jgi:hypothetical protein